MKARRVALTLALVCVAGLARAQSIKEASVGVVLGEPIGATAKFWLDDRLAFDLGAGLSDGNAGFWGDILWHDWGLLPRPADGKLGAYLGAGPQIRAGDDTRFGIRTIIGVSWKLATRPLEFFAEAGPLFRLTQGGQLDAVGGVGLRFSFAGAKH